MNFQKQFRQYKQHIDKRLLQRTDRREPRSLYKPIQYILDASGKRVRPVLTLLSCEAVGGRWKQALDAAAAIEILHSFTLVHDDIMDNADTRRGLKTIHKRWDQNTAILAGDEMVALAYQSLLKTRYSHLDELVEIFTEAFNEVCEGQGLDEEFERQQTVSMREYIQMIDKKTAAMISAATTIGAMIGGGAKSEIHALRTYGRQLGRAFQVRDDMLDVTADTHSWGKTIGGDLKEGKKTYLLIRAIERTRGRERALLQRVVERKAISEREIQQMKRIFEHNGVLTDARTMVHRNTRRAQDALRVLRPDTHRALRAKEMLVWLADELLERKF